MNDLNAILRECVSNKIELFFVDGRLNFRAPKHDGLENIVIKLKQRKAELAELLAKNPELRPRSMAFFSKVVGREIFLSWQGKNPKVVYLDSLRFAIQEIETLKRKNPSADELRAVCQVKEAFDGEVQDR